MNTNASDFSNVFKKIIDNSEGKDTLKDKLRTQNFLKDFAPGDSFQKEKSCWAMLIPVMQYIFC